MARLGGTAVIVGIPRESSARERCVALVPGGVPALLKAGLDVVVEPGAGIEAGYPDEAYAEKGARIASSRQELFSISEILLQVRSAGFKPTADGGQPELDRVRPGGILIGFLDPLWRPKVVKQIADAGLSAFAMELMPRISRAQSMDALSSMATITGYKAVLLAAEASNKMFPMLMTAAGTVTPARVFVIGAGVAGLMAISTAKRLGAVVEAYDVRPVVKEQVESLGAKFVVLDLQSSEAQDARGYAKQLDADFYRRQQEQMTPVLARCDIVITTAVVPGKKAPLLITREMVRSMHAGSVIVDIATEYGGNCDAARPGEEVVESGVRILGPLNLPATVPFHASQLYSKNITTFLLQIVKAGQLQINLEDEVIRETLVARDGHVTSARVQALLAP